MNRGDIVEVDWPYSDLSGTKVRPAVVVRADFLAGLTDDVALVKITGKSFAIPGTEVRLDPTAETASGLNKVCYACCYDLLTRDQVVIGDVIGSLSDAAVRRIDASLKTCLDLP